MRKIITLLLVIFMVISFLVGCAKNTEKTATDDETKTLNLVWFQSGGTDSLFEIPWMDNQSLYPEMVLNSLVKVKKDGITYVPRLAKEWEISEDGLTYTFTLDKKAKWHDGKNFTQEDVLFSINSALQFPKFNGKTSFSNIQGAQDVMDGKSKKATGVTAKDGVVTIKLEKADNSFLFSLTSFYILPKHLLKDADSATIDSYESYWKKPIGTGAYKIDEVSFPNYFTVVRNEDFFGPKAGIKKALFTSYDTGGNEAVIADLIAGKIDYAYGNAINDINTAKNIVSQNPDVKMLILPATYLRMFWFNTNGSADDKYSKDIKKPEVRRALNLLIDKETIASFYEGQAVALSTLANPKHRAYNSDIPLFERNVQKAKQMLKDADFDFDKTLRLLYYYDDQITKDIMELVKQNFAEADVKVEPFLAQGDLASIIYEQRNWDFMYAGGGQSDPIRNYNLLVPAGTNYDKIFAETDKRMKFKDLMSEYKATTDMAEQKKIGNEIQALGNQLCYATGIYALNTIILYNSKNLQIDFAENCDEIQYVYYRFEDWKLLK